MPTNPYAAPDIARTSEPPQAWRLEYTMGWQEYAQIAPALHQYLKRKWWLRLCIVSAWLILAALLVLAYQHIGLWALCALVPLAIILFENLLVRHYFLQMRRIQRFTASPVVLSATDEGLEFRSEHSLAYYAYRDLTAVLLTPKLVLLVVDVPLVSAIPVHAFASVEECTAFCTHINARIAAASGATASPSP